MKINAGNQAGETVWPTVATKNAPVSKPSDIKPESENLVINWEDGNSSKYRYVDLRAACPCAQCVDEWSGERRITAGDVPQEVKVDSYSAVGNYAVAFNWSDGHNTGLYAYTYLKKLSETASQVSG